MLVVGDKEVESESIGIRSRKDGDIGAMSIDKFTEKIQEEVKSYKI